MNQLITEAKAGMEKAIEHVRGEFSKLRVGRANTAMVENVKVDAYGSMMTLKEVAALAIPDARTITIQPWDKGLFNEIERGILAANVGLTPMNDGKIIRLNMPPLTEDRRKDFVKQIKKFGEDAKVAMRNIRRDAMDGVKKQKDPALSEDEMRRFQDEMQKVTDHYTAEADKLVETKSKEVMTL
jgi:ribosome recycling factor